MATSDNNNRPPVNTRPPVRKESLQAHAPRGDDEEEEERKAKEAQKKKMMYSSVGHGAPYGHQKHYKDPDSVPTADPGYEPPLDRGKGIFEMADDFLASTIVPGTIDSLTGAGAQRPVPHAHHHADHGDINSPPRTPPSEPHPALVKKGGTGPRQA